MKKSQAGFSMIEMVIAMGFTALVVGMIVRWQYTHSQQMAGEIDADNLAQFQYYAGSYFTQNRDAMLDAMWSGANASEQCVVGATGYDSATGIFSGGTVAHSAALHTCAIDEIFLKYKGYWAGTVSDPSAVRYVAIFKRRAGTSNDAEAFFAKYSPSGDLNATDGNNERALALKTKMGSRGGIMPRGTVGPCVSTHADPKACGAIWTVSLSDFIDPAQLAVIADVIP